MPVKLVTSLKHFKFPGVRGEGQCCHKHPNKVSSLPQNMSFVFSLIDPPILKSAHPNISFKIQNIPTPTILFIISVLVKATFNILCVKYCKQRLICQ